MENKKTLTDLQKTMLTGEVTKEKEAMMNTKDTINDNALDDKVAEKTLKNVITMPESSKGKTGQTQKGLVESFNELLEEDKLNDNLNSIKPREDIIMSDLTGVDINRNTTERDKVKALKQSIETTGEDTTERRYGSRDITENKMSGRGSWDAAFSQNNTTGNLIEWGIGKIIEATEDKEMDLAESERRYTLDFLHQGIVDENVRFNITSAWSTGGSEYAKFLRDSYWKDMENREIMDNLGGWEAFGKSTGAMMADFTLGVGGLVAKGTMKGLYKWEKTKDVALGIKVGSATMAGVTTDSVLVNGSRQLSDLSFYGDEVAMSYLTDLTIGGTFGLGFGVVANRIQGKSAEEAKLQQEQIKAKQEEVAEYKEKLKAENKAFVEPTIVTKTRTAFKTEKQIVEEEVQETVKETIETPNVQYKTVQEEIAELKRLKIENEGDLTIAKAEADMANKETSEANKNVNALEEKKSALETIEEKNKAALKEREENAKLLDQIVTERLNINKYELTPAVKENNEAIKAEKAGKTELATSDRLIVTEGKKETNASAEAMFEETSLKEAKETARELVEVFNKNSNNNISKMLNVLKSDTISTKKAKTINDLAITLPEGQVKASKDLLKMVTKALKTSIDRVGVARTVELFDDIAKSIYVSRNTDVFKADSIKLANSGNTLPLKRQIADEADYLEAQGVSVKFDSYEPIKDKITRISKPEKEVVVKKPFEINRLGFVKSYTDIINTNFVGRINNGTMKRKALNMLNDFLKNPTETNAAKMAQKLNGEPYNLDVTFDENGVIPREKKIEKELAQRQEDVFEEAGFNDEVDTGVSFEQHPTIKELNRLEEQEREILAKIVDAQRYREDDAYINRLEDALITVREAADVVIAKSDLEYKSGTDFSKGDIRNAKWQDVTAEDFRKLRDDIFEQILRREGGEAEVKITIKDIGKMADENLKPMYEKFESEKIEINKGLVEQSEYLKTIGKKAYVPEELVELESKAKAIESKLESLRHNPNNYARELIDKKTIKLPYKGGDNLNPTEIVYEWKYKFGNDKEVKKGDFKNTEKYLEEAREGLKDFKKFLEDELAAVKAKAEPMRVKADKKTLDAYYEKYGITDLNGRRDVKEVVTVKGLDKDFNLITEKTEVVRKKTIQEELNRLSGAMKKNRQDIDDVKKMARQLEVTDITMSKKYNLPYEKVKEIREQANSETNAMLGRKEDGTFNKMQAGEEVQSIGRFSEVESRKYTEEGIDNINKGDTDSTDLMGFESDFKTLSREVEEEMFRSHSMSRQQKEALELKESKVDNIKAGKDNTGVAKEKTDKYVSIKDEPVMFNSSIELNGNLSPRAVKNGNYDNIADNMAKRLEAVSKKIDTEVNLKAINSVKVLDLSDIDDEILSSFPKDYQDIIKAEQAKREVVKQDIEKARDVYIDTNKTIRVADSAMRELDTKIVELERSLNNAPLSLKEEIEGISEARKEAIENLEELRRVKKEHNNRLKEVQAENNRITKELLAKKKELKNMQPLNFETVEKIITKKIQKEIETKVPYEITETFEEMSLDAVEKVVRKKSKEAKRTQEKQEHMEHYDKSGEDGLYTMVENAQHGILDSLGNVISKSLGIIPMSHKMRQSKSIIERYLARTLLENPVGYGGSIKREFTAPVYKEAYMQKYNGTVIESLHANLEDYARRKGVNPKIIAAIKELDPETSAIRAEFDREVKLYVNDKRMGKDISQYDPAVIRHYEEAKKPSYDNMYDDMASMETLGMNYENRFEDYLPQAWDKKKIDEAIMEDGIDSVIDLLTKGYISRGIPEDEAGKIAKELIENNTKVESGDLDKVIASSTSPRARARNDIDLSVSNGKRAIVDLLEADNHLVWDRYKAMTSGWNAMNKVTEGRIKSEQDIEQYKRLVFNDKSLTDKEYEDFEINFNDTVDLLLNRPPRGGLPSELIDVRDGATVAYMGGLGIASLIEQGKPIARELLSLFSGEKFVNKVIEPTGIEKKEMLKEIETLTNIKHTDVLLLRQINNFDTKVDGEVSKARKFSKKAVSILTGGRRVKALAARGLNTLSGQNKVTQWAREVVPKQYIMDLLSIYKGKKQVGVRDIDNGIADHNGLDKDIAEAFKFVEFRGDTMVNLNVHLWPDKAKEKINLGIHRYLNQEVAKELAGEMPSFMNNPYVKLVLQFRGSAMLAQYKHLQRSLMYADKEAVEEYIINLMWAGVVRYAKLSAWNRASVLFNDEEYKEPREEQLEVHKYIRQNGFLPDAIDLVSKTYSSYKSGDYVPIIKEIPAAQYIYNHAKASGLDGDITLEEMRKNVPLQNTIFGRAGASIAIREYDSGDIKPYDEIKARQKEIKEGESTTYLDDTRNGGN